MQACGVFGVSHRPDTPKARLTEARAHQRVSRLLLDGISVLQHRGLQSAGMTFGCWPGGSQQANLVTVRNLGLVDAEYTPNAFTHMPAFEHARSHNDFAHLIGDVRGGLAHVRYTTSGTAVIDNAQPMPANYGEPQTLSDHELHSTLAEEGHDFAISFNGNLTNYHSLVKKLGSNGWVPRTNVDTEIITELIRRGIPKNKQTGEPDIIRGIKHAMRELQGAYSVVVYTKAGELVGFRDFLGYRPLVLGKLRQRKILASETIALDAVNAKHSRDIRPGEIYYVNNNGQAQSFDQDRPKGFPIGLQHCILEPIYYAHHDSVVNGKQVWYYRTKFGEALAPRVIDNIAKTDPVLAQRIRDADPEHPPDGVLVVPVPRSGIPQGIGLAKALGVTVARQPREDLTIIQRARKMARSDSTPPQLRQFARDFLHMPVTDKPALIRRRGTQRSFIQVEGPREDEIEKKFLLNPEEINGKHIILVDDSIIRGTTMQRLIKKFRDAGAASVHVVSTAPPILASCYMGVAMKDAEMIAKSALTKPQRRALRPGKGGLDPQLITSLHPEFERIVKEHTGADSITYSDIPLLLEHAGLLPDGTPKACTSCMTGSYAFVIDNEAVPSWRNPSKPALQKPTRTKRA